MPMTKPITPDNVVKEKEKILPEEVIVAFNRLIAEKWNGRYSSFKQDEVIEEIIKEMGSLKITSKEIFKKHYLDVEDIYKEAGWNVEYDSPAYCETYPATFKFSKKT